MCRIIYGLIAVITERVNSLKAFTTELECNRLGIHHYG